MSEQAPISPEERPHILTFKPRRRRLGAASVEAYARMSSTHLVEPVGPLLELDWLFAERRPLVLEIGFGGGEALLVSAAASPDRNHLGVEVHQPGVARVLRGIAEFDLDNVMVTEGDALDLLGRLPARSLAEVRIFFPDPWPKIRHHKRRIVRPDVVDRLVDRLEPGGVLRLATDWEDYAEQMERVCSAHPLLSGGCLADPAGRPVTRFEERARREGRPSFDLAYSTHQ